MLRATLIAMSLVVIAASRVSTPAPQSTVNLAIELEKTRFLQNERIFLWIVTTRAPGDERLIPASLLGTGRPATATFTIEAPEILNHSMVWGRLHGGGIDSSFFIPPDVLETANGNKRLPMRVDRLDWDSLKRFPHVTVAPGATWRLSIPLSPWLGRQFGRTGGELSFSTEMQMLVGAPDGEWRGFSPVRLIASGATKVE